MKWVWWDKLKKVKVTLPSASVTLDPSRYEFIGIIHPKGDYIPKVALKGVYGC